MLTQSPNGVSESGQRTADSADLAGLSERLNPESRRAESETDSVQPIFRLLNQVSYERVDSARSTGGYPAA